MKPKVAVLGAGAMGSLFGSQLADGGLDVTLIDVWRDHVDAINDGGLRIVGHRGERRVKVAATTDPAACGAADAVLVQCKAASTTTAVRNDFDAGLFRDDTVAISFQNGLGNEEMSIRRAHPLLPSHRSRNGRPLPLRRDSRRRALPRLVHSRRDGVPGGQHLRPTAQRLATSASGRLQ